MTTMRFIAACKANKPVTGIAAGTVAIFDAGDGSDWSGATDPMSNLDKVVFHSALDYMRIIKVVTSDDAGMSSVALAAMATGHVLDSETTLFAHGLDHIPLLSCDITVGGYQQPCEGTALVIPGGTPSSAGWRFVGFTADATNVYMHTFGWAAPAMTINWRVRVFDEVFQTTTPPEHMIFMEPGGLEIAQLGKVDTDHRFVRKVSGTGDFRVLGQQTIKLDKQPSVYPGVYYNTLNFHDGSNGVAIMQWMLYEAFVYGTPSLTVTGMEADL